MIEVTFAAAFAVSFASTFAVTFAVTFVTGKCLILAQPMDNRWCGARQNPQAGAEDHPKNVVEDTTVTPSHKGEEE